MGMGMGFMMSNQMGSLFQQPQQAAQQQAQPAQQAPAAGGPPPLPTAVQYFVAMNNQQAGPFDLATLQQMIARGEVGRDTLVWTQGMAQWAAASAVSDISGFFGSVPPPLPNA